MSKSSELDKVAKRYIIDQIDATGYDVPEPKTDAEKVQFLYNTFMQEYGFRVEQIGQVKALADYFAGLPSCCTVAFYNADILELARQWGSLPEDASWQIEDRILNNWWNFVANKTAQLFRKHANQ